MQKPVTFFPDGSVHLSLSFIAMQCGVTSRMLDELIRGLRYVMIHDDYAYPDLFDIALAHYTQKGSPVAQRNLAKYKTFDNHLEYFQQFT